MLWSIQDICSRAQFTDDAIMEKRHVIGHDVNLMQLSGDVQKTHLHWLADSSWTPKNQPAGTLQLRGVNEPVGVFLGSSK